MEKDAVQLPTIPSGVPLELHAPSSEDLLGGEYQASKVPTVDLKSPLKIDETKQDGDEGKIDYGEKLFLFGIIFCGVILAAVIAIAYFSTQNTNQTQQAVTSERDAE